MCNNPLIEIDKILLPVIYLPAFAILRDFGLIDGRLTFNGI